MGPRPIRQRQFVEHKKYAHQNNVPNPKKTNPSNKKMTCPKLLLFLVVLLSACGGKKTPKTDTGPARVETIQTIHFFLETSASMGGYLKGNTAFKDVVTDVVTKTNQIRPVSLYTISAKPQPFAGDVGAFVAQLATTPLATGKSSELHQIFGQVGQRAKNNDIAILVSDCILSFPDADIRRDPEVNRNNASSTLKASINNQFAAFSKQGIGATVLAYTSPFNGTYYTYQNQKKPLVGETRPFYIWIIGKQTLIAPFTQQLLERLSTPPAKQLDFGMAGALNRYDLFFGLNKSGKWRATQNNLADIELGRRAKSVEFAIGLNLSALPAYAQAETYLKTNLRVGVNNGAATLVKVQKREAIPGTRLSPSEQKLLSQNTHVLTFRVDNLFANAAMTLSLPVRYDAWYTIWSTLDDRTTEGRQGKTFAFEPLMTGVREAYQTGQNSFVETTIQLQKD